LLDFLYHSVLSEGGDGDALWYTRFYDLDDIQKIVEEYNDDYAIRWKIKREGNFLTWGDNQEWIFITDDEDTFKNQPDWIVIKLRY